MEINQSNPRKAITFHNSFESYLPIETAMKKKRRKEKENGWKILWDSEGKSIFPSRGFTIYKKLR